MGTPSQIKRADIEALWDHSQSARQNWERIACILECSIGLIRSRLDPRIEQRQRNCSREIMAAKRQTPEGRARLQEIDRAYEARKRRENADA